MPKISIRDDLISCWRMRNASPPANRCATWSIKLHGIRFELTQLVEFSLRLAQGRRQPFSRLSNLASLSASSFLLWRSASAKQQRKQDSTTLQQAKAYLKGYMCSS